MSNLLKKWDRELNETISIEDFLKKAINYKKKQDILETTIVGSYTLLDALDGQIKDPRIAREVQETLKELSQGKFVNETAMQDYFKGMIERGDKSVNALVGKLKGTLGELEFKHHIGDDMVKLSESGSQKGWDLAINRDGVEEYIQVKMYKDPNVVIHKIKEVQKQLVNDEILNDNGEIVNNINWAVSKDVFQSLKENGIENKFGITLYEVPMTSAEAAAPFLKDIDDLTPWNTFFDQIGLPVTAAAISGMCNTFSCLFGEKTRKDALIDATKQTALAYVAVIGSHVGEAIALGICPPLAPVTAIAASMWTRSVVKGFSYRFSMADVIEADNVRLNKYIEHFI